MGLPVIETPTYELTIPSTNKSVEYRPYLVKEEKLMIIALESNDFKNIIRTVRDIIHVCTFEQVDVSDLALFDLEYIFMKLRSSSVGAVSNVKLKCSSCQSENDVAIDLNEVEVKGELKEELVIGLTDKVGVTMKYPTVKGTLQNSSTDSDDSYDIILSTIISAIDSIYDADSVYPADSVTKQELIDFVESLDQMQFNKLNEFFEHVPMLAHTIEFKCTACGDDNELELKGLQNFFS